MADTVKMYQGDAKAVKITVTDEAAAAVNCSTATEIKFTCYDVVGGTSQFQKLLSAGDISVGGADNNVVTVNIEIADTPSMAAARAGNSYYWDLEIAFLSNNTQTFPRDSSGDPDLGVLILYGDLS